MKNINYKQLKRYDIGKMPISSGYQRGQEVSTADFTSSPAYNMQNETSAITKNAIGNTISQAGTIGTNLYNMATNVGNISKGISAGIATNAQNFSALTSGAAKTTLTGLDLAAGEGGRITVEGLKDVGQAASNAAKTGLNAAGYVAGGIGAALGTYGLVNDAIGFNDSLKENDMMNMSSRGTSSKYGVSYNTYGGLDVNGIKDYTNAQNTASTLSMTMNGLGTGASIGGMIGGPIGMGIGAAIGGIGGLVGGLFGSKSRKQRVEDSINSTLAAQQGYNLQAESEAGSKGLRNQYNITHADKGKNIQLTDNGKQGEIRMVHTSKGIVPGVMLGLAGKGESIYDPVDGTASVFEEGKKRVDNIPTGVPLNSNSTTNTDKLKYDNGGSWAQQIIFGNLTNPMTGNSFADDAKPYAKILEQYNKGKNNMNLSKHTELVNRKNAMNALNNLASIQSNVSKYKCGKVGKFDPGKPLNPLYTFAQAPFLIKDYTDALKETPYAPNSFVANPYGRQALDIQAASKYDPSRLQEDARRLARQQNYTINQQGGLSSAQKLNFNMANNMNLANQYQNILQHKQEFDANRNQAYAQALMNYGADEARRGQTALATQQEAYAKAVGAKQRWQQQALKNMSSIIPAYLQNRSTYDQFMAMYDLYNRQVKTDELRVNNDIENQKSKNAVSNYVPNYGLTNPINNLLAASSLSLPEGFIPGIDYKTWRILNGIKNK